MVNLKDVKLQAQWEIYLEEFESLVEKEKEAIRSKNKVKWYNRYRLIIVDTKEK